MATEKATGSAAGVATEPAPRSDPRPIAVASAAADASVTVLAAGYGAAASAALFHDARLAQPSEAEVDVEPPAPMPAGSPASVEPVARWYDDLADALPFAGALPFGLDALGQAARGLLSHLEAAADSEATDPAAYDFAWLAGATAALGGAGYAARGAAERHRAAAAPGPRSPLAAWGGRHARD